MTRAEAVNPEKIPPLSFVQYRVSVYDNNNVRDTKEIEYRTQHVICNQFSILELNNYKLFIERGHNILA